MTTFNDYNSDIVEMVAIDHSGYPLTTFTMSGIGTVSVTMSTGSTFTFEGVNYEIR